MNQPKIQQLSSEQLAEVDSALLDLPTRGSLIYDSPDQAIHRFQVDQLDLIAKSYSLRTFRQKAAAFFKNSRADRSYRAGLRLRKAGINTPQPFLLRRHKSQHILVTEFCPHKALLEWLEGGEELPRSVPINILKLLHQLADLQCSHGDFHARNLLIDQEGIPHLIDLDGVQSNSSQSAIIRDRDRLLKSLKPLQNHYQDYLSVLGAPGSPLPELSKS